MKMQRSPRKQTGATVLDFILWVVFAVFVVIGFIKLYSYATEIKRQGATVIAVVQLDVAAERVKSGNHADTDMSKVCSETRNAAPIGLCGESRDGVGTNQYGGDYTLTGNPSNLQQKLIGVTNINGQYIDDLADSLAKISAGNCQSAEDCDTITVSGNTITVTM